MENMHEYLIIEGTVLKGIVKNSNPVSVVIPEGITEIGESAFDGCTTLESITIPESVTKIGQWVFSDWAFGGCKNFKTVQYEGTLAQWCEMENDWSLMKNAEHVFLSDGTDIKALTDLVIPEGVAKIGSCAFRECKSLISITIPESVTEIVDSFEGCIHIKTVKCGYTLAQWCKMKHNSYLMKYAESVLLGDGTDIKKMTDLVIPEGVAKIGDWALEECAALTSVVIPESVTEISQWAFSECKNLKTVQYGGTLAQWCEMKQSNDLMQSAEHVLLGDGTDIKKMTDLVIPESVVKIGRYAFCDCMRLTSIVIHESVTEIGSWAFEGCKNLNTVQYGGTLAQWCAMENDWCLMQNTEHVFLSDGTDIKALTKLVIPEGVAKIGQWAFDDCKMLADLLIPESVKKIGESAFTSCTSLKSITIPSGVDTTEMFSLSEPPQNLELVKYGGTFAQWCAMDIDSYLLETAKHILLADGTDIKALTELVIPAGVAKIGENAFKCCAALETVTIPEGVAEIGREAFENCTALKTVNIPESMTEIGGGAFENCIALKNVTIPKSVTKIYAQAFRGCTALTNVTVPENVTVIGYRAFGNCAALESVTIPKSVTQIGGIMSRGSESPESGLSTLTRILENTKESGYLSFEECPKLKDVYYDGTKEQWRELMKHGSFESTVTVHCSDGDIV